LDLQQTTAIKMSGSIRTFIAIRLPKYLCAELRAIQENIHQSGLHLKWVPPQNIHLTLKFLGEVKEMDLLKIHTAMKTAAKHHHPISISAGGMGVFPNVKRPRVLWTGIHGETERLADIQKVLEHECYWLSA
jgi:2'-5' RNA ligase